MRICYNSTMIKKISIYTLLLSFGIFILIIFKENYYQSQNISKVLSQHLDGRLIPHKADYTNKLKNILSDNLLSFEFDTRFNSTSKVPYFEIGHDIDKLDGRSFEDYLKLTKNKNMKKIWMDIKNVDDKNLPLILKRLNYLNDIYNFKDILIFETSSHTKNVQIISDAGYHTSFYVELTVFKNIKKTSKKELENVAKLLKKQIESQHIKALSFPSYMYSFVKDYMEPIISKKIVYHTWATYKFNNKNELEKIQKQNFYKDSRIKTIIYTYYNNKPNRLYDF